MSSSVADRLWSAIGDPTRRRMIDLMVDGDATTATELSDRLPITRQAVAKHLQVLDDAGLVHSTTSGRARVYRVDDAQLRRAAAQLAAVGASWDRRLGRIAELAERIEREKAVGRPATRRQRGRS